MKRNLLLCGGLAFAAFSLNAVAAPGEYWEITSQMDMPGMPVAMPAQTSKVCLPKGGEGDPNRTQGKDSNCTFTDMQRSGKTVKFKGTCVNGHGDKMNVSGETTHDSNSFKTKMQMSGDSHGRPMNMSMNTSGKRVGGSCDAEEVARKAQAQADEGRKMAAKAQADACAVGANPDTLLVSSGHYVGDKPMCSNKKEYCQAVRDQFQHDAKAYEQLVAREEQYKSNKDTASLSIARICGLDLGAMKKAVCKNSVHSGPAEFMDKNCGAREAKEYREYARTQDSCARDYTSPDQQESCRNLAKCGSDVCGPGDDAPRKEAAKSGGSDKSSDSGKSKSDSVLDGAKKLRGLLPF